MAQDARLYAPAALRNRQPIADLLRDALPARGIVLEIASGTGEHALFLAEQFPDLTIQPSDIDPSALASIAAWREAAGRPNLLPPVRLDVRLLPWPIAALDAILCVNMLHISPWEAGLALFRGAAETLPAGGLLYLYGPYDRGAETEPSNLAFDASLKRRNPEWGLRPLDLVLETAGAHGFATESVVAMPANNQSLLLRKRAG
jgi:SAM-dependent methyltransferase